VSRNELPETAPEGIDDQTWFYLHETLRKFDSAINRLDDGVSEALNTTQLVKPRKVNVFCGPSSLVMLSNGAATEEHCPISWGSAGSGYARAISAGFPNCVPSQTWHISPDGGVDMATTFTFGAAAGTLIGSNFLAHLYTSIPTGFTEWDTVAVEFDYGFNISGASAGSTGTVVLGLVGDSDDVGSMAVEDEAGGVISKAYSSGPSLKITKGQLAAAVGAVTFIPGSPIVIRVILGSTSTSSTSSYFQVGRLRINWS